MSAISDHFKKVGHIYIIGFCGGLFAALLFTLAYVFGFLPVGPNIIWKIAYGPESAAAVKHWWTHLVGVLFLSVVSLFGAIVYYLLLRRMESPWVGLVYGLALWLLFFIGLNPILPHVQSLAELGWQANVVYVCIFAFYGLFVGYSISYEHMHQVTNQV